MQRGGLALAEHADFEAVAADRDPVADVPLHDQTRPLVLKRKRYMFRLRVEFLRSKLLTVARKASVEFDHELLDLGVRTHSTTQVRERLAVEGHSSTRI
jgi:hypothetical protein